MAEADESDGPGVDVPEDGALVRAFMLALRVDPEACRELAAKKRLAYPGDDARRIAERLVESYARKGAAEGFVTGLPTNPLIAFPAALVDVATILRFYAHMTAIIGYLANPSYFDDPDWEHDALLLLAGPKVIAHLLREAGVQASKSAAKQLVKKYLSKEVLKAVKKFLLKWFGKKVTQRAIIGKLVPVVGGGVGAVWNYVEIRLIGSRTIRYHFDDELA